MTIRCEIPGLGDVLFCHGTPRHENEIFTRLTAEDRLLPVFEGLNAAVVVCGHTHMQFDRMVGAVFVLIILVAQTRWMGPAIILLSVGLVLAYGVWVAGRWRNDAAAVLPLYLLAIAVQCLHFTEE